MLRTDVYGYDVRDLRVLTRQYVGYLPTQDHMKKYISDEYLAKLGLDMDTSNWECTARHDDTPFQTNNVESGVFMLTCAEILVSS